MHAVRQQHTHAYDAVETVPGLYGPQKKTRSCTRQPAAAVAEASLYRLQDDSFTVQHTAPPQVAARAHSEAGQHAVYSTLATAVTLQTREVAICHATAQ